MLQHDGSDFEHKVARVRDLLAAEEAGSMRLTSRESLSWLLEGARVTVPIGGDPVCSALVTTDEVRLAVFANEVDRLREEELVGIAAGLEITPVPWHSALPTDGDRHERDHAAGVRALRAALLPAERDRYRRLGADAAAVLTDVLAAARPGDTERETAAAISGAIAAIGAEPVVVLVAGATRLDHRHPLPTGARLGERAMAVVCARRHGLVANLTRWIGNEPDPDGAEDRILEVEADVLAATRPGRRLDEVLGDVAEAYARHGFAADEWERHHQGGPTGYAGRDPRASPATRDEIVAGQAFAWNPSAPRRKVEDTVVIDHSGVEVLTADPRWPTRPVRGVPRPLPIAYAG